MQFMPLLTLQPLPPVNISFYKLKYIYIYFSLTDVDPYIYVHDRYSDGRRP